MTGVETVSVPGLDIGATLRPLAMLAGDPTIRLGENLIERATITPDGPGALRITWQPGSGYAEVATFGDGAGWLLERAPAFLGAHDDPSDFVPENPVLRRLSLRFRGLRVGRTQTLWHDLAWTIVQQRVRRSDAAWQWRRLVETYGDIAPEIIDLRLPPDPARLARTSPDELRRLGIDAGRSRTLIGAAVVASRLQRFVEGSVTQAYGALTSLPGVGSWTVSCLSAFTWGDPDTVIVGDSGIPTLIVSTLTSERRGDDSRMIELLEPYRPNRYRVLKLVFAARTSPRMRY